MIHILSFIIQGWNWASYGASSPHRPGHIPDLKPKQKRVCTEDFELFSATKELLF
jgi:hypothetical protein